MKTTHLLKGIALVAMLAFASCSKDSTSDNSSPVMSAAKTTAATNTKIDDVSNDLSDITDSQIASEGGMSGKSSDQPEQFLPDCVTASEVSHTDTSWTRTLTFTNCPLPNGNIINGTLTIEAVKNTNPLSLTITYTFSNFHHNGTLVEGTRTVVKSLKSTDTLATVHPVDDITMEMTFTFADGSTYYAEGTKTREMIDGFLTPLIWHDDVFSITGNWTITAADGNISTTITTPLIRKMECHNIVSGVISIVKNDKTATVDYGNGSCDNVATVTVDGETKIITIGKN